MWIDVGEVSRDGVLQAGIDVGCPVAFVTPLQRLGQDRIMSKALDDRVGCLVVMEVLRQARGRCNLLGVFTVQEEIGARGAAVSGTALQPDVAVAIDTVPCPGAEVPWEKRKIRLGEGPVIRVIDFHPDTKLGMISPPELVGALQQSARDAQIPYQKDVLYGTYLDSSRFHLAGSGVPMGSLCIPRYYSHSPVEVAAEADIVGAIDLMIGFTATIRTLETGRKKIK